MLVSTKGISRLFSGLGNLTKPATNVSDKVVTSVKDVTVAGKNVVAGAISHPVFIAGTGLAGAAIVTGKGLELGSEGLRNALGNVGIVVDNPSNYKSSEDPYRTTPQIDSPGNTSRSGSSTTPEMPRASGISISSTLLLVLGVGVLGYFLLKKKGGK